LDSQTSLLTVVKKEADMTAMNHADFARHWKDIVVRFLLLGVTTYGGPASIGMMQAELQERRQWVSQERFVEGLSLVNMLSGAGATQLSIFLGYARGGWWGGLLAGLCFVLPAFVIMLALTIAYATLSVTPVMRGALYGLGPVVVGLLVVAVYHLRTSALRTLPHVMIALAATITLLASPLGVAAILLLAGGVGLLLFHSKTVGAVVLVGLLAGLGVLQFAVWSPWVPVAAVPHGTAHAASVTDIGLFFVKVGALTFGGGLSMIPFLQDHVVYQLHWLTPQEFVDGLALGQCMPGPLLMVAAYVGYKVVGVAGAVVGAIAIFLPSFLVMLSILPVLDWVRTLVWTKAALEGIGPAVIGVLAVSLVRIAPQALPDLCAAAMLVATALALAAWHIGAVKLILSGAVVGVLRSRLWSLLGVKTALSISVGGRV